MLSYSELKRHTIIFNKNQEKSIEIMYDDEMMIEDMKDKSDDECIVKVGDYLLLDIIDSSNTNKSTLNYILQELVKKENRIKHLVSSSNYNITLPEVIDSLVRDEVII